MLLRTVRSFFPDFNDWLDRLPDSRVQDQITYERRFLVWWGLALFLLQLGSRRQLDFDLDSSGTHVLENFNRLAGTQQTTRPVHGTLEHFLGHSKPHAIGDLRRRMVHRLIRMKMLDSARLLGRFVVVVDATGLFSFTTRHCDHCLVQRHETHTVYSHQVLEAKLLGPEGMVLSIGSVFIENPDLPEQERSAAAFKQDCELKAFSRLVPELKSSFPQTRLCLAGDSLYACGRVFAAAQSNHWSYVLTFKEGHLPAVWQEYQSLLLLCPDHVLERTVTENGQCVHQVFRWVHQLSYQDDEKRTWTFNALQCQESVDGQTKTFVWITDLSVTKATIIDIATQGGRHRWHIENQGFNRQKNSGFHLEHMYSTDPENLKAYYYLLQIAHILLLLLENGKHLRQLAKAFGKTPVQLFGSLQNITRRLLESLRYFLWPEDDADETSDTNQAKPALDTS